VRVAVLDKRLGCWQHSIMAISHPWRRLDSAPGIGRILEQLGRADASSIEKGR
jgi:hypothetical protein